MQVSLPQYQDRDFLKRAHNRYRGFWYLMKRKPGAFMVPPYDIDLMWHAHQASLPARHSSKHKALLSCGPVAPTHCKWQGMLWRAVAAGLRRVLGLAVVVVSCLL